MKYHQIIIWCTTYPQYLLVFRIHCPTPDISLNWIVLKYRIAFSSKYASGSLHTDALAFLYMFIYLYTVKGKSLDIEGKYCLFQGYSQSVQARSGVTSLQHHDVKSFLLEGQHYLIGKDRNQVKDWLTVGQQIRILYSKVRNWKAAFSQLNSISWYVFRSKNEFIDVVYGSASTAFTTWKDAAIVATQKATFIISTDGDWLHFAYFSFYFFSFLLSVHFHVLPFDDYDQIGRQLLQYIVFGCNLNDICFFSDSAIDENLLFRATNHVTLIVKEVGNWVFEVDGGFGLYLCVIHLY